MLKSSLGLCGGMTAPHRAASLAGRDILAAGGTAIEAMVAAAATIAVVYPHMNGIGGDGFWVIKRRGKAPIGISACGTAAALATPEFYASKTHTDSIPARGGLAALTVPGTISGWDKALSLVAKDKRLHVTDSLQSLWEIILADSNEDYLKLFWEGASQIYVRGSCSTHTPAFFLSAHLSTSTGSDVTHRIAAPMLGGMLTVLILNLLVLPVLYSFVLQFQEASKKSKSHQVTEITSS